MKVRRLLFHQNPLPNPNPNNSLTPWLSLLRHFSSSSLDNPIVTQALDILQSPHDRWNIPTLNELLFSDSLPSQHRLFFKIAIKIGSSEKALKFLEYVQSHAPLEHAPSLASSTFQAVLELASRESDNPKSLYELYRMSKERDIVPLMADSAVLLISSFKKLGLVDELVGLFNDLDKTKRSLRVYNDYIDGLLRFGRCSDALKVLDEMLDRDSECVQSKFTCDIVFSDLVRGRNLYKSVKDDVVVGLVSKFGQHSVFPNPINLSRLITRLCRDARVKCAWDVLQELIQLGGPVESHSCNALLDRLGKDRDIQKMNELLAQMKDKQIQPNAVTFGILINHLCKFRRVDDALVVLDNMCGEGNRDDGFSVKPDVVIYNTLVDGLCKVGRQEEGLELVKRMKSQSNCAPNTITYNSLIDGCCKSGEIERARQLFDQMGEEGVPHNVITVNIMIDGMCKHGRVNRALKFFQDVKESGLALNANTYTSLINAFCGVNNINKAMELFEEMFQVGCKPDAIVYYSLISGLTQAGRMEEAASIVYKLKEVGFQLDIACYNMLINGFCKKNKLDRAYSMLKDMELAGVKPDSITYNTLISHFCRTGNFKTASLVSKQMVKQGLVPTVVTYGAMIHAYCLGGKVDEAMKIFESMWSYQKIPPNTVIYNILIDALCKSDKVEQAASLVDDMIERGVKPNTTTFNAILKGLKGKNLLEKAFVFMDIMTEQSCKPDYITMEVLTEWLSSVGEVDKLRKFVRGYEVSAATSWFVLAK